MLEPPARGGSVVCAAQLEIPRIRSALYVQANVCMCAACARRLCQLAVCMCAARLERQLHSARRVRVSAHESVYVRRLCATLCAAALRMCVATVDDGVSGP